MPEYLAPGVYVEEVSYRARSIEGVSTTTTGFIGPTRFGPLTLEPDVVTSISEFERTYGDGQQLVLGGDTLANAHVVDNYMWHAARAFFNEGGKRLYVSRVFTPLLPPPANPETPPTQDADLRWSDGVARWATADPRITLKARYPGAYGNMHISFTLKSGPNILGSVTEAGAPVPVLGSMQPRDLVWIRDETSPYAAAPTDQDGDLWLADQNSATGERDPHKPAYWQFSGEAGSPIAARPIPSPLDQQYALSNSVLPASDPGAGISMRVVTLTATVTSPTGQVIGSWGNLPLDPAHKTGGAPDSFSQIFGPSPPYADLPFTVEVTGAPNGLDMVAALFTDQTQAIMDGATLLTGVTCDIDLKGGNDGQPPHASDYEGTANDTDNFKTGLKQFEDIDEISIVAAPGSTWNYMADPDRAMQANTIIGNLLTHAQQMRYRIAVIDCAERQSIADVRKMRAKIDSNYGAFYYPWVSILDPITQQEINLPPSGFVSGIYARNDVNRSVVKAPANEVVNTAIGFERLINRSQQEVLNPEGINCFRFFENRGYRLWGARLLSSDPEWKYVNLRRYFAYLEHSIDKGTQWAVFEPNGPELWHSVRRAIQDFLLNEWLNGALLGDKPQTAYFVKCDRSTMSQNDLDNGRMVALVGVSVVKPAEFVIFRIGQWTGDSTV